MATATNASSSPSTPAPPEKLAFLFDSDAVVVWCSVPFVLPLVITCTVLLLSSEMGIGRGLYAHFAASYSALAVHHVGVHQVGSDGWQPVAAPLPLLPASENGDLQEYEAVLIQEFEAEYSAGGRKAVSDVDLSSLGLLSSISSSEEVADEEAGGDSKGGGTTRPAELLRRLPQCGSGRVGGTRSLLSSIPPALLETEARASAKVMATVTRKKKKKEKGSGRGERSEGGDKTFLRAKPSKARLSRGDLVQQGQMRFKRADAGVCVQLRLTEWMKGTHWMVMAGGGKDEEEGPIFCLPTFLIIGVQKGSTGELRKWLSAHPQVQAHRGERHFFDMGGTGKIMGSIENGGRMTAADVKKHWGSYLQSHAFFISDHDSVRRDDPADNLITFEKTPAYFDQADPAAVAALLPSAKLVVMLREPAQRMYSGYFHCLWNGRLGSRQDSMDVDRAPPEERWRLGEDDWQASQVRANRIRRCGGDDSSEGFDAMLMKTLCRDGGGEEETSKGGAHLTGGDGIRVQINSEYDASAGAGAGASSTKRYPRELMRQLRMGDYMMQIDAWTSAPGAFSLSQLLIIFAEDFKRDPFRVMSQVESFVGIKPADFESMAEQNERGFWQIKEEISGGEVGFISKSGFEVKRPPMSAFAKATLDRLYRDSNDRLRSLVPNTPW